jgi:uncharacterized tellurite resistance protein B-like protein
MGIIAALLGAMGVIGMILWRLNQAADATKGLAETAQDLSNLGRRWSWRRKANVDAMTLVDDPRIAAVTLMAAVAQADGALTAAERETILRLSSEKFSCSPKAAQEMLSYGRFLVGQSHDPANSFRKLLPIIRKTCGPTERSDLIGMLRTVAAADGTAPESETLAIDRFARDLA